jgi:predicted aldo/keto reductase-like oxidoreductase
MRTVRLGRTGLEVSRIGMGSIPLNRPTEDEAIRVVQYALDLGINFIDTGRSYRASEERIGKAVAGRRDQVIIATKSLGRDKATAQEHLELSLKYLHTETIDLWQFHNVGTFEVYERVLGPGGAMEAAQEALQAGKIRHIGVSSHNLDVALKAVSSGLFETIQFPFNFVANEAADELVSLAREHDVGFIAMKPFAGGQLQDANLAIKFLLQFDPVVPVPGVEKVAEIAEIAGIVNSGSWKLRPQERQKIEDIHAELGTRFCRWCGYCLPCPQELNIPMLMNIPNSLKRWGWELLLSRLGKIVESGKNCIQCGECETKCPYQLPIREMIAENIAFYERVAAEHSVQQNTLQQ